MSLAGCRGAGIRPVGRPELSPLLLGPLSRNAGGWGSCGDLFVEWSDADYQRLLQVLKKAAQARQAMPRYAAPGWQPNRQCVREMKRFAVLPADFDPSRATLDPFGTDQSYGRSLW